MDLRHLGARANNYKEYKLKRILWEDNFPAADYVHVVI